MIPATSASACTAVRVAARTCSLRIIRIRMQAPRLRPETTSDTGHECVCMYVCTRRCMYMFSHLFRISVHLCCIFVLLLRSLVGASPIVVMNDSILPQRRPMPHGFGRAPPSGSHGRKSWLCSRVMPFIIRLRTQVPRLLLPCSLSFSSSRLSSTPTPTFHLTYPCLGEPCCFCLFPSVLTLPSHG